MAANEDYTLSLDDRRATVQQVGGKGAALAEMARADLPVPEGFHVTTGAYRVFIEHNDLEPAIRSALEAVDPDTPVSLETASRTIRAAFAQGQIPPEIARAIVDAYNRLPGTDPAVAVRSSVTAEDLPGASFAGQQDTYLNIAGPDALRDAVKRCWASLWTARAIGYRARQKIDLEGLSLAVVIQRLVPAQAAGVLFTANPVCGQRDEALVNAAWGLGEAVVGGEVTPDTFTVDKVTGEVREREVAEKLVMTVRAEGGTETVPVPEDLRGVPVLDDAQIADLVNLGSRIEALYGDPRDIEWALADGAFAIVQARPITALPAPVARPPEDWPLPDPEGKYMRSSIIDFMPDPLSPLFASMAIPAINDGMRRMVREMMGTWLSTMDHYLVTINDYAYMTAKFTAGDIWRVLTKMVPSSLRWIKDAERHYEEVAHPRYAEVVAQWEARTPETLSAITLLEGARALTQAMGDYLTTLQVDSLGIAAGAEMLFTMAYEKLIRRAGDPPAPTYLLGSDSLPIQAEKALYDLAQWCREHDTLAAYLQHRSASQIAEQTLAGQAQSKDVPPGVDAAIWYAWQERLQDYLDCYGHSVYSPDFAKPIPAHDPVPPLQTLQVFVRGEGCDPHARQQQLLARREAATEAVRARTGWLKRRIFNKTLGWARTFTRLREDSIFEIGLGYPVLRRMLLTLAQRLVDAGALMDPDDIFWLTTAEAEQSAAALDRGEKPAVFSGQVELRKMRWRAEKRVTPPHQLPKGDRIMGMKMDAYLPVSAEAQTGDTLKGVAASPGQVTGIARVLHGPEDFDQMRSGEVLVADITTPAWTPLFALAAGIVTNVGGPLSHGSIVAREYGIPAVLGTGVATKRIHSGMTITVDGDEGRVIIGNDGDAV